MWLKKLWKATNRQSDADSDSELKPIVYRGGLLKFSIPASWVEEYEDQGGGTFYADVRESGTLRLNVMTFSSKDGGEVLDTDKLAKQKATDKNGLAIILDEGNALVRYDSDTLEAGENITIRYWEVYNPVPPHDLRIAVFSYTLLSSQFKAPRFQQELDLLDREIANAQFATQLGDTN